MSWSTNASAVGPFVTAAPANSAVVRSHFFGKAFVMGSYPHGVVNGPMFIEVTSRPSSMKHVFSDNLPPKSYLQMPRPAQPAASPRDSFRNAMTWLKSRTIPGKSSERRSAEDKPHPSWSYLRQLEAAKTQPWKGTNHLHSAIYSHRMQKKRVPVTSIEVQLRDDFSGVAIHEIPQAARSIHPIQTTPAKNSANVVRRTVSLHLFV